MTAEELFWLPDDGLRHELIKGELLTMSPSGESHGLVSAMIAHLLLRFVVDNNLGIVYGAETGFQLEKDPDTVLAPDVTFISRERVGAISDGYRSGPPDLVVEVLSPSDRKTKIEENTARWLEFGVKAVWIADPKRRTVEIVRSKQRKLFTNADEINEDEVFPGLRLKLSDIFS